MGWVHVVNPTEIKGFDAESGKTIAVLDLQVSTSADLPSLGDVVENYIIAAGSNAQIVRASTPTFVTLDGDDGNWYPLQGGSSNNSLSLSPTLNKAITDSTDDMIDLTEDDIDRISDELEEPAVKEQKKAFVESVEEPEQDGDDDERELL